MSALPMQATARRRAPRHGSLEVFALARCVRGGRALVGPLVIRGVPFSTQEAAWPLVFFALLAIAVERESIPVTATTEVSVAFLPLVFVAVVFGPLAAAVGWRRDDAARVSVVSHRFSAACGDRSALPEVGRMDVPAAFLFGAIGGTRRCVCSTTKVRSQSSSRHGACLGDGLLSTALTSLTMRVRGTENANDAMHARSRRSAAAGIPIYGAVAALLAYAYSRSRR